MSGRDLVIRYRNHRGEVGIRTITPRSIIPMWFGNSPPYHPEFQWFLTARCHKKNAFRNFAVRDIIEFLPKPKD